jgi:hypothetical protein
VLLPFLLNAQTAATNAPTCSAPRSLLQKDELIEPPLQCLGIAEAPDGKQDAAGMSAGSGWF